MNMNGGSNQPAPSRIPGWVYASAAPVLVTIPFVGTAFQGDQRLWMYLAMNQTGGTLWGIVSRSFHNIDFFLSEGNFRPLGRALIDLEHVLYFRTSLTTGIPPHILHGFVRLGMVIVLAVTVSRLLSTLERSVLFRTTDTADETPLTEAYLGTVLFPMVFATAFVVVGIHPLIYFPGWHLSVLTVALAVPLLVASDVAINQTWSWQNRSILRYESLRIGPIFILGAALAMTYDLLYLVPPLCLAVIVLRGYIMRVHWRKLLYSLAAARLVGLAIGFLVVFIPTRLVIASRCAVRPCEISSDLYIGGLSPGTVLTRMATGLPVAGWYRGGVDSIDTRLSWERVVDHLFNGMTPLVIVLLVVITIVGYKRTIHNIADMEVDLRVGIAGIILGLVTISLPALMVSLSFKFQNYSFSSSIGVPWRETLLVQIGWALSISGLLVFLFVFAQSWLGGRSYYITLPVFILAISATLVTFGTNSSYAELLRSRSTDTATSLISTSLVNFNSGKGGSTTRCTILEMFEESWKFSYLLQLNQLTDTFYNRPFCNELNPLQGDGIFVDDDSSQYETEIETLASTGITKGCGIYIEHSVNVRFFCPERYVTGQSMLIFLRRMAVLGLIQNGGVDAFGEGHGSVLDVRLSRAEVAEFLVDVVPHLEPARDLDGLFADIEDADVVGYAEAVYRIGALKACTVEPLRFCPNDPVTRAEVASLIVHTTGLNPVSGE